MKFKIKAAALVCCALLLTQCGRTQETNSAAEPKGFSGCKPQIDDSGYFLWGCSVQGRQLIGLKLGTGKKNVVIMGNIHGSHECNTHELVQKLSDYYLNHQNDIPSDIKLYILPSINPDGCVGANSRTNAHNVDLNRNWQTPNWKPEVYPSGNGGSSPFSEPETTALSKLLTSIRKSSAEPMVAVSYHSRVPKIGAVQPAYVLKANNPQLNPLAETLARQFAANTKYDYLHYWTYYEITGEFINWAGEQGISAFDVELTDGSMSAAAINAHYDRNLPALKSLLKDIAAR